MNSDPHRDSAVHVEFVSFFFFFFPCACARAREHVCSLCFSISPGVHDVHTNERFGYTPLLSGLSVCLHDECW